VVRAFNYTQHPVKLTRILNGIASATRTAQLTLNTLGRIARSELVVVLS
jgi:hypothetical protein